MIDKIHSESDNFYQSVIGLFSNLLIFPSIKQIQGVCYAKFRSPSSLSIR